MTSNQNTEQMTAEGKKLRDSEYARSGGFTGDACHECGNFTTVRTGTCLSCVTCGSTSGCS